jgi:hypothetical protein
LRSQLDFEHQHFTLPVLAYFFDLNKGLPEHLNELIGKSEAICGFLFEWWQRPG